MACHFARDFTDMQQQLVEFDCARAECFCCCAGHVLPHNGAAINCDREVVYSAIRSWSDDGLAGFEEFVHQHLHVKVKRQIGVRLINFRDALYISLPVFWTECASYGAGCIDWNLTTHRMISAF